MRKVSNDWGARRAGRAQFCPPKPEKIMGIPQKYLC
jgi:hypothetical protein